jgi:hypothetical protein
VLQRLLAPTYAAVHPLRMAVEELHTVYPTMAGIEQDHTRTRPFGPPEPVFRFVDADGDLRSLADVGIRPFSSGGVSGDFVVRPRIGDAATAPPSEFLTLWALLSCLSELARYYPDTWVRALDPDRSAAAVTIEHGLELALERTPALIGGALEGPIAHLMREGRQRHGAEAAAFVDEDPPAMRPVND